MNYKFYTLIFTLIFLPNLLFAAWWNPFSWFKNDDSINNISTHTNINTESNITADTSVLEQEIIKNISTENPELQKQINTLINENRKLNNKLILLEKQLASCSQTSTFNMNVNTTSTAKNPMNEEGQVKTKSYTEENYTNETSNLFKRLNQLRFDIPDLKEKFEDDNCNELLSRNQNVISPTLLRCKDMREKIIDLEDEEEKILKDINFLKSKYGII